jgi:hypothetical protein
VFVSMFGYKRTGNSGNGASDVEASERLSRKVVDVNGLRWRGDSARGYLCCRLMRLAEEVVARL